MEREREREREINPRHRAHHRYDIFIVWESFDHISQGLDEFINVRSLGGFPVAKIFARPP
jgi:hypothetical protein